MAVTHMEDNSQTRMRLRLPYWAKSTNPIVRRHLGLYWRTIPPETRPIFLAISVWLVVVPLGFIFPFLLTVIMPITIAALLITPVAYLLQAHILYTVARDAASAMQEEMGNNTMLLLRTTPMSLNQIFLGKVASAMWRRMDDIALVLLFAALFTAPIQLMNYAQLFPNDQFPLAVTILTMIEVPVSLLRVVLEVVMVGVLAVLIGSAVPYRSTAIATSIAIGICYFIFMNLIRFIPGIYSGIPSIVLIDIILPVLIPMIIIFFGLRLTVFIVTQD